VVERIRRAAGDFTAWLAGALAAIDDGAGADVPCDGCTACCVSSQFVHVDPDEQDALAHIPNELLVPAPGLPAGHLLMGYDGLGRCPMLVDDRCSIYEHRPRACRTYDCRVFPATGVDPGEGKALIAERVAEWEFGYPTERDRAEQAAVRAAASYLDRRRADFPAGAVPSAPTQLAVLAIRAHAAFVAGADPDPASVRVAIRGRRSTSSEVAVSSSPRPHA
jgi:Fe-S-cluster containining protein